MVTQLNMFFRQKTEQWFISSIYYGEKNIKPNFMLLFAVVT